MIRGDTSPAALSALDDATRRLEAVWADLPLRMRRALFVTDKALVYGGYTPRDNAVFKSEDSILTYIEPVGYSFRDTGDGLARFGVVLDYDLLARDGTVVTGKKAMLTWSSDSRDRPKELMLNASLNFTGLPEGRYVLRYTLHDINDGRSTDVDLPFRVAP